MLPTQEEQDSELDILCREYKGYTNKITKEYAKWYAEQVIKHCVEVATIKYIFDAHDDCVIPVIDEESILNIKKLL